MEAQYVESSALLSHLLGEGPAIESQLANASRLLTSVLTLVEADRGMRRARAAGRIGSQVMVAAERWLREFSRQAEIIAVDDATVTRARRDFPIEPVRAIDAMHLASALLCAERLGDITVLSLDERVRANAEALGLAVAPAASRGT